MKLSPVFQTASVPIPDRSGFDLSREHLLTARTGTLVPAECFEVLPNDTISMGGMMKITLPPFAVPFMGRIDACLEAFFVPSRILWKGWQSFITQNAGAQSLGVGTLPSGSVPISVPRIDLGDEENQLYMGPGTLMDYLGISTDGTVGSSAGYVSAMKLLAYHKVVDHWYRDQNNIKPFFAKTPLTNAAVIPIIAHFIDSFGDLSNTQILKLKPTSVGSGNSFDNLVDTSIGLGSLRQRCWAKDYFTTMTTRPQAGDAAQITFSTSGATGSITVSDIRVANALQKWLERNNIAGTEYGSQILAHFGVTPPDAVLDKPLLLGQIREPVYVSSVENNATTGQDGGEVSRNPFANVTGSAAGYGSSFGKGSLIPEFHAKEHGYIMVMFSLVPHAYYNSGIERDNRHLAIGDFAWPEYSRIGDQSVSGSELTVNAASNSVAGYNQRYSEYKFRVDKISGLLRDGQNLDVYALQRGFTVMPALGKEFLEIPVDYLDQVYNAADYVTKFAAMADIYFDTRAIRLLPQYSLPSL